LIRLEDVDVSLYGHRVLHHISWELKAGENWAIMGPNGSGKSTLLRLMRGDIWPQAGRGKRTYCFDGRETSSPIRSREKIAMVSPESQAKYKQYEWALTGREAIYSGFFDSQLLHQTPDVAQQRRAEEVLNVLHIEDLASADVQQMSEGEFRKILIARALVNEPAVLILDEFCAGLDAASRQHILRVVENIARGGTQILFTTHRVDEIVPSITHIIRMRHGKIEQQGERRHLPTAEISPSIPKLRVDSAVVVKERPARADEPISQSRRPLVRIVNSNVFIDGKAILRDINWQIIEGENWAFFGGNGAGKSTLLKLILGELHPAWGGHVYRFDSTDRQSIHNSIWNSRKKIGFVSTELQTRYREDVTAEEAIASGFFSSIGLIDEVTPGQWRKVRDIMDRFGMDALAGRSVLRMSYGQMRKILITRALVNDPQILLLDEPFDGLDPESKDELVQTLNHIAHTGRNLVLVSHHASDLLPVITHGLILRGGRIVAQNTIAHLLADEHLNS
jgi:molybdate transport system ATP-binding protein